MFENRRDVGRAAALPRLHGEEVHAVHQRAGGLGKEGLDLVVLEGRVEVHGVECHLKRPVLLGPIDRGTGG